MPKFKINFNDYGIFGEKLILQSIQQSKYIQNNKLKILVVIISILTLIVITGSYFWFW
jgi:hypothetical protein